MNKTLVIVSHWHDHDEPRQGVVCTAATEEIAEMLCLEARAACNRDVQFHKEANKLFYDDPDKRVHDWVVKRNAHVRELWEKTTARQKRIKNLVATSGAPLFYFDEDSKTHFRIVQVSHFEE